jgi:hypothetical protein
MFLMGQSLAGAHGFNFSKCKNCLVWDGEDKEVSSLGILTFGKIWGWRHGASGRAFA